MFSLIQFSINDLRYKIKKISYVFFLKLLCVLRLVLQNTIYIKKIEPIQFCTKLIELNN